MGEAQRKKGSHRAILSSEARCIYCDAPWETIEHMPPRMLFTDKKRPDGLIFASCSRCNNATRGADAVASLFSRLSPHSDDPYYLSGGLSTLKHTVLRDAPGVLEENFNNNPTRQKFWMRKIGGLYQPTVKLQVRGLLTKAYLDVFAGKIGMALYREHIGEPLPLTGGIQTFWYPNYSMTNTTDDFFQNFLPVVGTLRQGAFLVQDQFFYKYNYSIEHAVFLAYIILHGNLRLVVLASSDPKKFQIPFPELTSAINSAFFRPGELIPYLQLAKQKANHGPITTE